ncbi:E3 ubiquitin ligase PARAQUAT TOLERANCE 3 isoform X2 [Lactuca sativa]|uniref:DWNN domain-containing protein n=1 Tax=Lactuca sativa TaxID=4236 RepID=A0A9R1X0E3_LACSA|nr:E3 ubiquitin ligase PARAQUAT TOLERANCE 3 isoform X2 [Lactuca sativa]KAJ0193669.1 hypothetical protein LSAT_V11C800417540 [Lactuca sativa]
MSIRFKFRSSVNFDTIEIDGGKPYISVGELRSKILCQKKLSGICHKDFDLVFLDDLTGQEYNDDEFKIPSGSSVIIKRVPAEPVPLAMLRHHKPEASELSEDIPKGINRNKPEETILEKKPEPVDVEHMELEKVANTKGIDLEKVDLPSELRCPICNTYFKNAVMIPCCQHSFCKKCICDVLPLKARCPKCSSTKYRVEHLLPNLSLRHAIEHFLESQILATAPENDLQKYVPDGESGIQGKEVSTKRKLDLLYSEKGPNQNMGESVYESLNKKNDFLNSTPLLKVKNRDAHKDLTPSVDSEGENQPVMPQVCMPNEGGDRGYAVNNRNNINMGGRTCYMCGSPTHFIRDCPIASNEHHMYHKGDHMFQGGVSGYPMPYWNTPTPMFPPFNPYMNMYGNPGMLPFSPVTPYGVPPYVASTYAAFPVPSGVTRMGGMAPVGPRAEHSTRRPENLDFQNIDNRMKYGHEKRQRSSDYEDDGNGIPKRHESHSHELSRSSEYKSHRSRGKAVSNSEESHGRKLQKDHHYDKHQDLNIRSSHNKRYEKRSHSTNDGREHGSYHTDRSISGVELEVEDVHSGNHRYDEARHKNDKRHHHHHHHHSSRDQSDSDCSCSRHSRKRRDDKRKDTWQMVNGSSDNDYDHHQNKRKKVH